MEDPARAEEVAQAIDRQFANSPAETKTATEKAFMQSFAKQVGDTGAMMAAISAVVFFVILLIAGNTMAQSVRERTAELGVLKTIGFTDLAVTGMVLGGIAYALAMGFLGGIFPAVRAPIALGLRAV